MTIKLTFEGETFAEVYYKMQIAFDQIALLPNEPPPVGDEGDNEDGVLPFGEYGQPLWADGATGLIWVRVAMRCWPRISKDKNAAGDPVFVNPPIRERQIFDPTNPSRDEVLIYNKRFIGDKNSGETNVWVETAEHGALNLVEIREADRKRV